MSDRWIELFGGPGGWAEGARRLGIEPLGIEWDESACATRRARGHEVLQADVSALDPADFSPAVGVIASPPCPTFSAAGNGGGRHLTDVIVRCMGELAAGSDTRAERREEAFQILEPIYWRAEQAKAQKKKRDADRASSEARARRDADMSLLVVEPLRWVLALRPTFLACEQVPDVLGLWTVMAQFLTGLGYATWGGVLEAERYGVAQTRERAILLARLGGAVHPPEPTHQRYVKGEPPRTEHMLDGRVIEPWVSMEEALRDAGVPLPFEVSCPAPTVTAGGTANGGPEVFGRGGRQRIADSRSNSRGAKA